MDLENLARDAFGRVDDIFDNAVNQGDNETVNMNSDEDEEDWNEEKLAEFGT